MMDSAKESFAVCLVWGVMQRLEVVAKTADGTEEPDSNTRQQKVGAPWSVGRSVGQSVGSVPSRQTHTEAKERTGGSTRHE